ncbi:MAG: hypothetical protein UW30_C0005G0032 [Candidatus Giovannonibacteria bacterium GW2011_GWA2_44_13b]|uniref:Uncharacterized protein n=2 Tax=Candidatus Giovannoniibacteriota TaxID=1752738 RepID=A0A0G1H5F3_9BACT|nr:MAG: hypothetical protein UW30_C0005G0032 [Candidatus Giovannonibacteria bacterium GW2011_GWA2_44_13b]OGF81532.1 MAG: hypothetical protein A2924_03390 [Candidatus Giovannonibacteria bacterium RIFCSPLOWO2_01_FULL_44_16]
MELRKGLLWAGIGALSLATFYAVSLFLFGTFSEFQVKVLLTTAAVGAYSLMGFCSTGFKEKGMDNFVPLTAIAVGVSVVGAFVAMYLVWKIDMSFGHNLENKIKIELTCLVLSFALAQSSLLIKAVSDHVAVKSLVIGTLLFVGITAFMLINLILNKWDMNSELYFRFLITSFILSLGGSLTLPLVKKVTA